MRSALSQSNEQLTEDVCVFNVMDFNTFVDTVLTEEASETERPSESSIKTLSENELILEKCREQLLLLGKQINYVPSEIEKSLTLKNYKNIFLLK